MTEHTIPLNRKVPMTFTESGRVILVAGNAETVRLFFEEKFDIGTMINMAA